MNGVSIQREPIMPALFVYYHIELDNHALILAEGAPAETFIDSVDRGRFDNWAEYEALYPEDAAPAELPLPRAGSDPPGAAGDSPTAACAGWDRRRG